MQVVAESLTQHVDSAAARLRLVQLDFGDESPEARREYLASEVRQALERVAKPDQEQFLVLLGQRFPAFMASEEAPPVAVRRELTPAELLAELSAKGRSLPMAQRQEMVKQLHQAWGVPAEAPIPAFPPPAQPRAPRMEPPPMPVVVHKLTPSAAEVPSTGVASVLQRLGIAQSAGVEPAAITQLTTHLLDFALPLHPLVTRIWRDMAGRSDLPDRPLQSSIQCFVQGRNPELQSELIQLRAMIAAMINAIPHLAEPFCDDHLLRFQPAEIEEAVRTESSFSLWGGDNKHWAKYKQMAPMLESPAVSESLRRIFKDLIGTAIQATATKTREGEQ